MNWWLLGIIIWLLGVYPAVLVFRRFPLEDESDASIGARGFCWPLFLITAAIACVVLGTIKGLYWFFEWIGSWGANKNPQDDRPFPLYSVTDLSEPDEHFNHSA